MAGISAPVAEALTASEVTKFTDLESVIERGITTFVEVGAALAMIREQRLYRQTHDTFELYCRERWGWTARRARQLIEASDVVADVEMGTRVPIPTEKHARALVSVPKEERAAVWTKAVDESPNGKPTARAVREIVKPPEPEPETHEPDPIAEWERAEEELAKARETIESLTQDDTKAELATLHGKYRALEGRLRQSNTTLVECEKTATYAQGMLRQIREALKVEKDREIIGAIHDLMR